MVAGRIHDVSDQSRPQLGTTEVPPEDILPHHYRRITPYLYSPDEITALLQAAGRLTPTLRGRTWQTVLGLLA